jgi:hypothetical protein
MTTNPLIQDLIDNEAFPSVTVSLPTGGRWYEAVVLNKGVDPLDVSVGVLGILAEQNYRDPWLLLSGEAIPRMLKGVCPSVNKALDLCEIDLETILLAARLVSYGPKLVLTHKCDKKVKKEVAKGEKSKSAQCNHENTIELDINEHILRYSVMDDSVINERFVYNLKRVAQTVHLRPPPYQRVIEQMKEGVARDKQMNTLSEVNFEDLVIDPDAILQYTRIIDMASDSALENIAASIHAIETTDGKLVGANTFGEEGSEFIRQWLLQLPKDEAEGITDKINDIATWFASFAEIKYNCAACEAENKFRLELDANRLFGPAGDSLPPKKPSRKSKRGAKRRKIQ